MDFIQLIGTFILSFFFYKITQHMSLSFDISTSIEVNNSIIFYSIWWQEYEPTDNFKFLFQVNGNLKIDGKSTEGNLLSNVLQEIKTTLV